MNAGERVKKKPPVMGAEGIKLECLEGQFNRPFQTFDVERHTGRFRPNVWIAPIVFPPNKPKGIGFHQSGKPRLRSFTSLRSHETVLYRVGAPQ